MTGGSPSPTPAAPPAALPATPPTLALPTCSNSRSRTPALATTFAALLPWCLHVVLAITFSAASPAAAAIPEPRHSGLTIIRPRHHDHHAQYAAELESTHTNINGGSSRTADRILQLVNVGTVTGGNTDPVGTDVLRSLRDDDIFDPPARTNVAEIMTATGEETVTAVAVDEAGGRQWPARRVVDGDRLRMRQPLLERPSRAREGRGGEVEGRLGRPSSPTTAMLWEPRNLQVDVIDERAESGEEGGNEDDYSENNANASNGTNIKTLETTYDADNGSYGNMFLVKNDNFPNLPTSLELVVHTLSIHTDVEEGQTVSVEVYTRPDTYVGYETDSEAWTTVVENVDVTSSGIDNPTVIPSEAFEEEVVVPPGKTQAFYVTLTSEDLRYTDADDAQFGDVYVSSPPSDDDGGTVQILAGAGVLGYPFGPHTEKPRIFNGALHYSLRRPATKAPTLSPTRLEPTLAPTPDPLQYGDEEELNTTFESGNGGFGAFFTILAHETLRITSLDFHTDKEEIPLRVEVYTTPGEFGGHETSRESWRRVCSATVRGRGENVPTVIPPSSFSSVKIEEGTTASFYVTLTTEDLRYSNSDVGVGSVFVQTSSLEVLVGAGVSGYPAFDEGNGVFNSRVFNGVVHYKTLLRERNETEIDMSMYPTENSLTSTFEGGTGGFGAMFTISATVRIVVTSLSFHMDTNDRTRVEIWTIGGSYEGYEEDRGSWLKIADQFVYGRGTSEPTTVDESTFDPVVVMAGGRQSFYVTIGTTNMRYTRTDLSAGDEFESNDEVSILVGTGVAYPFGKLYSPRVFNGIIDYRIYRDATVSPTPSPTTAVPTGPRTPLLTQQRISVAGVSARRFLETFFPNGERHRRLELGDESVKFFENTTAGFVQNAGNETGIDVTSVIVSRDLSPEDIEVNSDAAPEEEDDPEFNGDGEPSIDMYTTIQGEYNPPPDVDFSEVVGDAFDEKGDAFVEDLKKDPTGFFEEATGVKAATVSFPLPTEEELKPKTYDAKEENGWLRYVYIACGVFGTLVVVGVVALLVVRRRRRIRQDKLQESAKSLDDLDEEEMAMSASCQNSRLVPSSSGNTGGGSGSLLGNGGGGGRLLGDCHADGADTEDDCSFASSIRTIDTKTSKTSKSAYPSQ